MAVVLVRDIPEKGFSSTEVSVSERVVEDYLKRGWKLKNKKVSNGTQVTEQKNSTVDNQQKKNTDNLFAENKEHTEKVVNAEKSAKTKKN